MGGQVNICDRSLTRVIPERFGDEYRIHYKALYKFLFSYLLTNYNHGKKVLRNCSDFPFLPRDAYPMRVHSAVYAMA